MKQEQNEILSMKDKAMSLIDNLRKTETKKLTSIKKQITSAREELKMITENPKFSLLMDDKEKQIAKLIQEHDEHQTRLSIFRALTNLLNDDGKLVDHIGDIEKEKNEIRSLPELDIKVQKMLMFFQGLPEENKFKKDLHSTLDDLMNRYMTVEEDED